jgi:hypothetical protein
MIRPAARVRFVLERLIKLGLRCAFILDRFQSYKVSGFKCDVKTGSYSLNKAFTKDSA